MTRVVEPSQGPGRQPFPTRLSVAHRYGSGDWIVPQDRDIQASRDPVLNNGPLNSFQYQAGQTSGRDITFGTGEAFVGGCYLGSDSGGHQSHSVTLPQNATNETVYLGFDHTGTDELKIGIASDFAPEDSTVELYTFDTDADSVLGWTDVRPYGAENAKVDIGGNLAYLDDRYVNEQDGNVAFTDQDEVVTGLWTHQNDLYIDKAGATAWLGGPSNNGGPHEFWFGNDGENAAIGGGLGFQYVTGPDELRIQNYDNTNYAAFPLDQSLPFRFFGREFSDWTLEQRTDNPGAATPWSMWARTDTNSPSGDFVVETEDGPYTLSMTPMSDPSGNLVVDDFEDSDLAEYNIPSSSGTASVVTARSHSGSRSLEVSGTVQPTSHPNFSPKLPYYPRPGDKWEFWVNFDVLGAGSTFRFYYGKQNTGDTRNAYEIHMYIDGTFRVEKDSNGTNTTIASQNIGTFTEDIWYRVRVWWNHSEHVADHHIELWNNNTSTVEATISGNDDTYTNGGILFWNADGTTAYVDDIQILNRE